VIAAGISNDATGAFFVAEGCDLVVSAAQLKSADGLQVFRFEIKLAAVPLKGNQGSTNGDPVQPCPRFTNVVEGNDFCTPF
jgi:hypothetical protein